MKTATDIMTAKVITVTTKTSVQELAKILSDNNISGVPVVDDAGNLLGIVTENDLIDQTKKLHIPTVITLLDSVFYLENPDRMEKEIKKMAGTTVRDIYSSKPVTVNEETPLDEIAFRHYPKKIPGIIHYRYAADIVIRENLCKFLH